MRKPSRSWICRMGSGRKQVRWFTLLRTCACNLRRDEHRGSVDPMSKRLSCYFPPLLYHIQEGFLPAPMVTARPVTQKIHTAGRSFPTMAQSARSSSYTRVSFSTGYLIFKGIRKPVYHASCKSCLVMRGYVRRYTIYENAPPQLTSVNRH